MTAQVERVRRLIVNGEQALYSEGDLRASRLLFDAAYRAAERDNDAVGMAVAALGQAGLWVHEQRSVASGASLEMRLRRALETVEPWSALGLRLRARLAAETDYRRGGFGAILAVLDEVNRIGDPSAWAEAVSLAHHCLLGPEHGAVRGALARMLIAASSLTSSRSDLLMGMLWHTVDLFLDADPQAERSLAELRGLLADERHLAIGFVVDAIDVMLGIRAGRFTQAESDAVACAERGRLAGDPDATGWLNAHLMAIRWYQGRVEELLPALREAINSPALSVVDGSHVAALAVAAASAGDHRQAAGAVARLVQQDLAQVPRSSSWLISIYGVVEATNLLHDRDTAATAYDLLIPFARLPMIASLGVACFGSTRHALGVAKLTTGDWDLAVDHLREAVGDNLAMGHWPAAVMSRSRLAEALDLRGRPGDSAAAQQERDHARHEAERLGMPLRHPARRAGGVAGGPDADRTGSPQLVVKPHSRQWRIELGHRSATVAHSVGMSYIHTLVANPRHEIAAVELAAGAGLQDAVSARSASSSDQPMLDAAAKRTYQRRLAELAADLNELEAMNDVERAAQVRAERDWLISELAATVGLHGRVRYFTGNDERARIAVGRAIRRALGHVEAADPTIGRVLRATIHTGRRCYYRPF